MCDCRKAVNKRLAFSNAKIAEGLTFSVGGPKTEIALAPPMIVLERIDSSKRAKLPNLLATCCPFCGERYEPVEDSPPMAARAAEKLAGGTE